MTYYERCLPHWQPEGAALFVTWRLHGSLPAGWVPPRGTTPGREFALVDKFLDQAATGPVWLKDPRIAKLVSESLRHGEAELRLYDLSAWVVMSNHIHVLWLPHVELREITRRIKNYTARQANLIMGRTGQPFWRDESCDHWVRDRYEAERIVGYIERNPVKAGLVARPEDWPWSSASC